MESHYGGSVPADAVIVATGTYTPSTYFRRRIITVGSFIIATGPLTEGRSPRRCRATVPASRR
ncbi:hypothetical protein SF83666_c22920 [Sinorhizobium fredii CCBAU 83666]|nr:hypothetical protein SF83666_c22920 [Sinorhizobium fredii CCBAU 83666]